MKNQFLLISAAILLLSSCSLYLSRKLDPSFGNFSLEAKASEKVDKARFAKEAFQWRYDRLKDENGNLSPSYFANARRQADKAASYGTRSSLGLQWEELGPDNIGGRTRAILIDKRDTTDLTVYAGGVSGGMWKSTDGGNTWNRLTAWNQWLTINCIAQSPAPPYTIYIGTGEAFGGFEATSFNSGNMGDGIFTLDANDNPTLITPDVLGGTEDLTPDSAWSGVERIAIDPVDPSQIMAGTKGGLYESFDAGETWSRISFPSTQGMSAEDAEMVDDVKWSTSGQYIWASFANGVLLTSSNAGQTWSKITSNFNPGFPTLAVGRMEVAIAPNHDSTVYILAATPGGASLGAYGTYNAGATWFALATAGPLFDPMQSNDQGWYDNVIAVNPFNPNKVYLAGVDFYTWSDSTDMKLADAGLGSSAVNPNYIHPDKHAIVLSERNPDLMYIGCDGGIYRSINAASGFPFPNFTVINRGYAVTQNYGIAAAITGEVFGGSQDNGTNYVNYLGDTRNSGQEILGGDGFFTGISHISPGFFFGEIYYGQTYRSAAYGAGFSSFYDVNIDPSAKGAPSVCDPGADPSYSDAPFCTPFLLTETKNAANGYKTVPFAASQQYNAGDVITATSATANYQYQLTLSQPVPVGDTIQVYDPVRSRFIITTSCGIWATSDALNLSRIPRWFRVLNSTGISGESFAVSPDGDNLYVGTAGGYVYKFPNFNAHADTTTYPHGSAGNLYTNGSQYFSTAVAAGRSVEGVAVDPQNSNHVVAVVAGFSASNQPHVYESQDGGVTWVADTAGLPNMPVYTAVIHDANTIIIGSELGIWSWDGSQWHEENSNFYRMPVYRMIETGLYTDDCPVLYVGSHGRGMWRSVTLTPQGCNTTTAATAIKGVSNAQLSGLNIYPNPARNSTHVSVNIDESTDVTLRVFDMTGHLYNQQLYRNNQVGQNVYDLNTSGLNSGTYLLTVTTAGNRTESRLFVVTK